MVDLKSDVTENELALAQNLMHITGRYIIPFTIAINSGYSNMDDFAYVIYKVLHCKKPDDKVLYKDTKKDYLWHRIYAYNIIIYNEYIKNYKTDPNMYSLVQNIHQDINMYLSKISENDESYLFAKIIKKRVEKKYPL